MKTSRWWTGVVLLLGFVITLQLSTIAKAQDQGEDQEQDPPGRVARLNYSQGSVSFQPAGEGDWVDAVPNRPMVTGDNLWADENSRAEAHIGSTSLRLGPKTGITFLNIDDRNTQIRVAQGSLIVRVRHVDDDDSYEIDTPNLAFQLLQPGEYRIDVSEDGSQTVTSVFNGRGQVTGGGFTYTVVGNQSATFTGSDHLDYDLEQLPGQDDFDQWAFDRDAREDRSDSANYVSREMTGYEDLDQYGQWSYVPGYGECWQPSAVAVGWAPYRFGHWVWVGPWGWTWVEDEPWGFAPFHYGRWAYAGNAWFWVPGPVVVRPVWAPALVVFVGGGPGFHFSAGAGVGWFPLAPGEVFVPAYHVSPRYVNNVNITNTNVTVTRVTNVYNTVVINKTTVNNITYVNQRVNNSVTVVSHDTFVNARPVSQNVMRVDQRELAAAPVTHAVTEEPVHQSVVGIGHPAPVKPPTAIMNRQVVAVKTPPPPPHPIEQRQAQAGGHLQQQTLVKTQTQPARPFTGSPQPARPQQNAPQPAQQQAARPSPAPPANNNPQPHSQPRVVWEQQGSTESEAHNEPANHNENQPANHPAPQEAHPLVKAPPPVQQRSPEQEQQQAQKFQTWQQQRPPAQAQPAQQHPQQQAHPPQHPPAQKPEQQKK